MHAEYLNHGTFRIAVVSKWSAVFDQVKRFLPVQHLDIQGLPLVISPELHLQIM